MRKKIVENNINDLLNLSEYSLPTLEISYNAREEDVADILCGSTLVDKA